MPALPPKGDLRADIPRQSFEFGPDDGGRGETEVATRDDRFSAAKPLQLFGLPLFGTSIDCFRGQQFPQIFFAGRSVFLVTWVADQIICLFRIAVKIVSGVFRPQTSLSTAPRRAAADRRSDPWDRGRRG